MKRETPGLQVALIIFVMLTIVLGVTSFIFFSQYREAVLAAKASQQQSQEHLAEVQAMSQQVAALKDWMSGRENIALDDLQEDNEKDMTNIAAYPQDIRCYHTALAFQQHAMGDANAELVECKEAAQQRDDYIQTWEGTKTPQVERHAEAARKAMEEASARAAEFRRRRQEITAEYKSMYQGLQEIHRRANAERAEAEKRHAQLAKAHEKLTWDYKLLLDKYKRLLGRHGGEKIPQGRVVRVSSQLRTAWIDLGRADSLPRRTEFDVYPGSAFQLAPAEKKGEIEVTKVLEDHLAEACVTKDEISDPIIGGDKIHSQTWDP